MTRVWPGGTSPFKGLLAGKRRVLVLLDFDGTLAPLVSRPSAARLRPAVRHMLRRLNSHPRLVVAVLSGRSIKDVEKRVGVPSLYYGGNHGLEVKGPGIHFQHPGAFLNGPALRETARMAHLIFQGVPGVEVEPKGFSLSIHYRRVPQRSLSVFRQRLKELRDSARVPLKWRCGRCVWECLPVVPWDKGRAAKLLARHVGAGSLLAVGDDVTDEDMFRAVKKRGLSMRVAPRGPTCADYVLASEADVPILLNQILAAVKGQP